MESNFGTNCDGFFSRLILFLPPNHNFFPFHKTGMGGFAMAWEGLGGRGWVQGSMGGFGVVWGLEF